MNATPAVYIIDDEEPIRSSMAILIGMLGYPVLSFDSAKSFLREYQADWQGCLFVDLRMPDSDGVALIENLSARNTALSIVLMTGNADPEAISAALPEKSILTLEKPFSVSKLQETLQACWPAGHGN